jgi:HK97 family phage major capsid protein
MGETELMQQFGELTEQLRGAVATMEESKASDTARWQAADASRTEITTQLLDVKGQLDKIAVERDHAKNVEESKALLESLRSPSKAALFGDGKARDNVGGPLDFYGLNDFMRSPSYKKGDFVEALYRTRPGANPDEWAWGKAKLQELGATRLDMAGQSIDLRDTAGSKATLGDSGATGGYVLPNNLVDTVIKPNTQEAVYTGADALLTVRSGVNVRGVDLPYRPGAPARMTVQTWGNSKENVNEAYGSYTASLVTVARIYDVGKQYLRFSAGSAEEDVLDELTKAAALAENYYVISGAGTAGNNGEPYGVYTALQNNPGSYKTTTTPVGNTILGSAAAGFATMLGALASRSRRASAIVVNAADFWTILAQGSDNAGFWVSPTGGPTGFSMTASGELRYWGVPVVYDANLTSKLAIAGDWKQLKFFRGLEFRIESSDQAGSRWDDNLVGFRGEEEIGMNAASAVSVGAFQYCTTIIP